MGKKRSVCKISSKPEGKISLARPMPRWDDNIKTGLEEKQ
jgi:hypothetical protein